MTRAQEAGLHTILCIGETLVEREENRTNDVLKEQLCAIKEAVIDWSRIVIAYEPVWAIGTGLSATPDIAQGVHFAIRSWLRQTYGDTVAEQVIIQYGGSVKPDTVDELMACPDIDGTLVGGASLSAKDFARICNFETTN